MGSHEINALALFISSILKYIKSVYIKENLLRKKIYDTLGISNFTSLYIYMHGFINAFLIVSLHVNKRVLEYYKFLICIRLNKFNTLVPILYESK